MIGDLLYALRQIVRRPALPIVVVASLGIAQGINTSLFSFVNTMLFAPWHVDHADDVRVVLPEIPLTEWRDWSARATTFASLGAVRGGPLVRLSGERVTFDFVSANYFQALGVPLQAGRAFAREDDDLGGAVAIVSDQYWRTRLGGDPNAIGRSLTLDPLVLTLKSVNVTIVGIAAAGFDGVDIVRKHFWMPMSASSLFVPPGRNSRPPNADNVRAFGHVAPAYSDTQAQAELVTLDARFRREQGALPAPSPVRVRPTDAFSQSTPTLQARLTLFSLLAGVTFITLIACANVANLLLARGHERRGEIATRYALGATRAQIVRQLLVEAALLMIVAAWLGLLISRWLPDAVLRELFQRTSPDLLSLVNFTFPLDRRVIGWVVGVSAVACGSFGLLPALRCSDLGLDDVLRHGQGNSRPALMPALLGYQTIVSVMALAIAGLMLRSGPVTAARHVLRSVDDVAVVRLNLPRSLPFSQIPFAIDSLADRLASIAGRENVVGASGPSESLNRTLQVTPNYFRVLELTWVSGRAFDASDDPDRVVVVNEAFARRFWPSASALGQTVTPDVARAFDQRLAGRQVIGVTRDAAEGNSTAYVPVRTADIRAFLVRGPRERIAHEMTSPSLAALPSAVTADVLPGSTWVAPTVGASILSGTVTMAFGAVALLLGTIGFFSLLEYAVRQRTREIGIRMALGADARHILLALLAPPSRAAARGFAIGGGGALVCGLILRAADLPAGINPFDVVTYAIVAMVIALAGLAASLLPARRAMRIMPSEALRVE